MERLDSLPSVAVKTVAARPVRFASDIWVSRLTFAVLGALLLVRSLNTGYDHDEDQYVGGAYFAAKMMIFRDFMHLQTPLQAWLFAPIAEFFPGHVYIAMRVANVLFAVATLAAVYAAIRIAGGSRWAGTAAMAMLAFCTPFQACASLVRNDIVPLFFSSLGIVAGITAARRDDGRAAIAWLLAGLAFGLATSAKISHAFFGAGAGLFLAAMWLRTRDRTWARNFLAYGVGGFAGLLPSLIAFAAAPAAFLWGVVEYGATAPFQWYSLNGLGHMLSPRHTVVEALDRVGGSPALPALICIAALIARRGWWQSRRELLLLDVLLVAGGIAAILPTPSWSYYYVTLLLPLFVRFGAVIDDLPRLSRGAPVLLLTVVAASSVPTLYRMRETVGTAFDGLRMTRIHNQALWIGDRLRAAGVRGRLVTFSPAIAIDSGFPLDRRFATGVFVYRSGVLLSATAHERFHTIGPATLAASLDRDPPAAILVGYESSHVRFRLYPDTDLRAYATARGYVHVRDPAYRAELYINPRAGA